MGCLGERLAEGEVGGGWTRSKTRLRDSTQRDRVGYSTSQRVEVPLFGVGSGTRAVESVPWVVGSRCRWSTFKKPKSRSEMEKHKLEGDVHGLVG